jgi:hypothetical protein
MSFCLRMRKGIKPDSAYRLGFVVVEYRWHPLYGKRVRLMRRTVHEGSAVVHVDVRGRVSRELPAWMVDASVCCGMELGPPEVSLAALNELRSVLSAAAAGSVSKPVSSFHEEGGSGERAATKTVQSTVAAVTGLQSTTKPHGGKRKGGSNQSSRRPVAGSSSRTDGATK